MDGPSVPRSESFESLVIANLSNVTELKERLLEIVRAGRDYNIDVSSCLKILICSGDQDIMVLTVRAIAELSKCEKKREIYAQTDFVKELLKIISKNFIADRFDLVKHSCRALGNICCDCDKGRQLIIDNNGVPVLISLLEKCNDNYSKIVEEIKLFTCKTLLNFTIGGQEMSKMVVDSGLLPVIHALLEKELQNAVMKDDIVSTALLLLSVINDNLPEYLYDQSINSTVLNVLRETTNVEISELCFDHLHMQSEHDSVKALIAHRGGIDLMCSRLELLLSKPSMDTSNPEVEAAMKQACDLIVIVLTGDEAMEYLYKQGTVYSTMVRWLDSRNQHLQSTAILAIGNFARKDEYCIQMMQSGVFDKLLDLLERYLENTPATSKIEISDSQDETPSTKIIHAIASAIRNLMVPEANKKAAAEKGRAAPLLLRAAAQATQHNQAYSVLAAIRMLVMGSAEVSRQFVSSPALVAAGVWGRAAHAAAAGEAARLLGAAARAAPTAAILEVEGCLACLVNMLVASHSIMQNEAILSLTLLAIEAFKNGSDSTHEQSFITQSIDCEIGVHILILIDTNCAKMPIEVAQNLVAFLEITSKKNDIAIDYKKAKVNESLLKLIEARKDFTDDMKNRLNVVIRTIEATVVPPED